jgi:hypothetical protein
MVLHLVHCTSSQCAWPLYGVVLNPQIMLWTRKIQRTAGPTDKLTFRPPSDFYIPSKTSFGGIIKVQKNYVWAKQTVRLVCLGFKSHPHSIGHLATFHLMRLVMLKCKNNKLYYWLLLTLYPISILWKMPVFNEKHAVTSSNCSLTINKRTKMALDRSLDPSTTSEQCLRQASWPSLMTIESKMWPLVCLQSFSIFGQCDLAFDPRWPIFKLDLENKLADQFPGYLDNNRSH